SQVVALGLLPLLPLIFIMMKESIKYNLTHSGIYYPLDISHFFMVFPEHFLSNWFGARAFYAQRFTQVYSNLGEGIFYLGYVSMPLVLIATLHLKKQSKKYWLAFLFFLTIALGPKLAIAGFQTNILMPTKLLEIAPFFSQARVAGRWFILAYLFWGILAGFGLKICLEKLNKKTSKIIGITVAVFVYILLFLDYYPTSIPSTRVYTNYPVYKILPQSNDYGIYNLPVLPHLYMIHQTHHEKPMVSGYISREMKKSLHHRISLKTWNAGVKVPLPKLKEELTKSNVKFIIYHKLPLYRKVIPKHIEFYSQVFKKVYEDTTHALFKVY
ncbi:hypothetical protein DID80_07990, partial [Candidatus Marinamargulisbacteria bacterium SCGC AAA071-K20]